MAEGQARRVTDPAMLERLAAAWASKWDGQWRFGVADGGFAHPDAGGPVLVFAVEPTKVLAFGKGAFTHTATGRAERAPCAQPSISARSRWSCSAIRARRPASSSLASMKRR
jgi:hypothetical protein